MWKSPLDGFGSLFFRLSGNRSARVGAAVFLAVLLSVGIYVLLSRVLAGPAGGLLVARHSNLVWKGPATPRAGADSSARVTFELDNVGGRPVRILSIESGCGCARPRVRPGLVAPGHSAMVEVTALMVPVGEKVVQFNLRH